VLVGGMLAVEQPRQAEGLGLQVCPSCLARTLDV
jgi:hypothetical protein